MTCSAVLDDAGVVDFIRDGIGIVELLHVIHRAGEKHIAATELPYELLFRFEHVVIVENLVDGGRHKVDLVVLSIDCGIGLAVGVDRSKAFVKIYIVRIFDVVNQTRIGDHLRKHLRRRRSTSEALEHINRIIGGLMSRGAVVETVERQSAGIGILLENLSNDVLDRARMIRRAEELVIVDERHIAALEPMIFDGIVIRRPLFALAGKKFVLDQPRIDITLQHFLEIVGAVVVVEIEMVDADEQMIIQPLAHIARAVLDYEHDRQLIFEQCRVLYHDFSLRAFARYNSIVDSFANRC